VLTKIGLETSLRYALSLIVTGNLLARRRKASIVDLVDIKKVYSLFLDERRSVQMLKDHGEEYVGQGEEWSR
jgi:RuvB-like protein 2